jgi:HSP20 family protein
MPGVKADQLDIDVRENVLTLTGRTARRESVTGAPLFTEYEAGTFLRKFTLAETIDQARIDAKLTNGVLRVELPKLARARPRQIAVRTG